MKGKMKVTVIATGFDVKANSKEDRVTWVNFNEPETRNRKVKFMGDPLGYDSFSEETFNTSELDVPTFIRRQAD